MYKIQLIITLVTFLCAGNALASDPKDGFLFTMPKVLRHGDQSEFCITVQGPEGGTKAVTMSLVDRANPKITIVVDDVYKNGEHKCNNFTVPKAGVYEMILYNKTALLHDSVEITVEDHSLVTLVQTDKPMYKPGQKVKFRILTFKSDQKPRTGTIEAIYIKNPSQTRVKQFLNVGTQGLASLEFQLTKEPEFGKWEVLVFLNESLSSEPDGVGTFEVKEYVLPRFEVKIKHPPYILASDDFIDVEVCASYTYGKPVAGFLDLQMCWASYLSNVEPCFHQFVQISGCYNVSVNVTHMEGYNYFGVELKTTASVTVEGTGAVVNATKKGPGASGQRIKLALQDYTNGFFKPLLPFYGKVIVTKPDGTPAPGENIEVIANDFKNKLTYKGNFTSDESGIVVYSLCGAFGENTEAITITAQGFEFDVESHKRMYNPQDVRDIRQWFSPSFSFIEIPKTESNYKCGDNLTLSIPFTTRANTNTDFHYQIMARGKIIKSGQISYKHNNATPGRNSGKPHPHSCLEKVVYDTASPTPPDFEPMPVEDLEKEIVDPNEVVPFFPEEPDILVGPHVPMPDKNGEFEEPVVRSEVLSDTVSDFMLEIPIQTVMAPKFTLLIYHTLPDGEVVADSMEYNVEPCFDNDVSMKFNRSKTLPGEKVNIHLEAEPGSVCGLGIVDKSVNILGGKHQITPQTIFKALSEYNALTWVNQYHYDEVYCEAKLKKLITEKPKENGHDYWQYSSNYVDALQAFMSSGLITLTDMNIQTRPCTRTFPIFYDTLEGIPMALGSSGSMPVPGGMGPLPMVNRQSRPTSNLKLRSHFPETWLWDLQVVGVNGTEDFVETAPHTITSWVGNAVCMDAETGVGVSPMQSLTTFQPLFSHIELPYAAVKGERIPVVINIFNYLEKCLYVQMTLETDDGLKILSTVPIREPQCVCNDKSFTQRLYVTPEDIGSFPITLKAEVVPGACDNTTEMDYEYIGVTDAVQRKLFVKAEGVMNEYTHTSYVCPEGNGEKVENLLLPLPEAIVKDSERGEVKVIGDIMGPALTNLDKLVRMPTGCGEQNMVGFTPNIFVIKYLTSTNRLTEEIQTNAIKHMEIGYQRELKYRHSDGSYSAFGEKDDRGSVWLTAFVVKSFAQARPYIYIDEMDMEVSLTFLRRKQLENGCFRETGAVFSSYMMGGLGKKKISPLTPLTAYVLIALLQADVNATENVIKNGFNCINRDFRRQKNRMDSYTLALLAYAHTLYNPESRVCREVMRMLSSKAKKDGSLKYWARDVPPPAKPSFMDHSRAPSAEVEMTAYALLASLQFYGSRAVPRTHDIAMWLSQQRNPYGGFASTQDTVVGMNALSEFAALAYRSDATNLSVSIQGNGFKGDFEVSEEKNTLLLLQTLAIPRLPNSVSFSIQGTGCALIQANVRFNVLSKELSKKTQGLHLKIQPRLYQHDINKCNRRTISLWVGNRGHHKYSKGMSMVTMKMVTGWTPIQDSLTKIMSRSNSLGLKRYEYDEEKGVVSFYLDHLKKRSVEIKVDVEQDRNLRLHSAKAAEVQVFQYYEQDVKLVRSYGLKTTCGTKAEIPRTRGSTNPIPVNEIVQVRIEGPPRLPPSLLLTDSEPKCPVCAERPTEVKDLKDFFCNSSFIYKAIAGRGAKKPIKLKTNLKASRKLRNVNKFVNPSLPEGCTCSLFKPPVQRVHIFTSNQPVKKALKLGDKSAIIRSSKALEKQLKRLRRACP